MLQEPLTQLRELVRRELRDLLFELFNSGHGWLRNKLTQIFFPSSNVPS